MTSEEISEVVNGITSSLGFTIPVGVITAVVSICSILVAVFKYKNQTANAVGLAKANNRITTLETENAQLKKRVNDLESRTTTTEDNIEVLSKNSRNAKVQNLKRKQLNETAKLVVDTINTGVEAVNQVVKAKRLRKRGE